MLLQYKQRTKLKGSIGWFDVIAFERFFRDRALSGELKEKTT